ncbi:T9SS type A sorting domain-containing protein [Flavobacterium ardleyense]|uniref:T9SS type A sorting domain-containing protein n=1 Tax=Flavobacterium ardleyense TaxID=2038737 RepID=A0ABW5ZAA0_9FLAO
MKQIFTLITLLLILTLNGQSIILESNFGTNGIKKILVDGEIDELEFLDMDTNSFLVYSKTYAQDSNVVYKINTDGTFDSTFGANGKLNLPDYAGEFNVYKHIDNSILIIFNNILPFSTPNNEIAIIRYKSNGSLDTSFGTNGEIRIEIETIGSDGRLVILNDNTFLFSNYQQFHKYLANGTIDSSYGINGILNVNNIGHMQMSNDGNLLFKNYSKIEKMDHTGNLINTFGTNGTYLFPENNDFLLKSSPSNLFFMEEGDAPLKFYVLNSNGTVNTNFNGVGNVDLTFYNGNLEYYENFIFDSGFFYFVGSTTDEQPFIVCYDAGGNLVPSNNLDYYKENLITNGSFTSIIKKGDYLYAGGDYYDEINNEWSFVIAKYTSATLSLNPVMLQNKITYNNPIAAELKINAESKIDSIEVFNLAGQKVQVSNSDTVNFSLFEKGVYLAKINFEDGETKTIKVLKN